MYNPISFNSISCSSTYFFLYIFIYLSLLFIFILAIVGALSVRVFFYHLIIQSIIYYPVNSVLSAVAYGHKKKTQK